MKRIDPFQAAQELLDQDPLPADTIEQLDKLLRRVPMGDRKQFDWYCEAAILELPESPA